jgi:integrase
LWHLGGSQSDTAAICAENIDWRNHIVSYSRMKTGSPVVIRFGEVVRKILQQRPKTGNLFPRVVKWRETDRAKAFMRRCKLVGVCGVSLHCYRYAWAERAKSAGYPERFVQEAMGHKSAAVHRAFLQIRSPLREVFEMALKIRTPNPPYLSCGIAAISAVRNNQKICGSRRFSLRTRGQ